MHSDHMRFVFRSEQPLILASASPRRQELLRSAGLTFEAVPSGVEEVSVPGEHPEEAVRRWALEKARAVSRIHPDHWILAADTIVVLGGVIFGKPADGAEAASMLRQLSGRANDVISGVCLLHRTRRIVQVQSVRTQVHFKDLSAEEIAAYVGTGEPLDKAGAYGIQGMGAFLVRSVCGSYTNVVGLPLCETLEWLLKRKIIAPGVGSGGFSATGTP